MILDQIFEAPIKSRDVKQPGAYNIATNPDPHQTAVLGRGAYGAVYKTSNPERVNKMTDATTKRDIYLHYILQTSKMRNDANPYVPKVFSVKYFNSESGRYAKVAMERLIPLRKATDDQLRHAFSQMTGGKLRDIAYEMFGEDTIVDLIKDYILTGRGTLDPRLKKVLNLIRKMRDSSMVTVGYDIKEDNMMLRPSDSSLVITDPLVGYLSKRSDTI